MVSTSFVARVGLLFFAWVLAAAGPARAEIVAVVCPPELQSCFDDWVVHRAAKGRRFVFIDPIGCESPLATLRIAADQEIDETITVVLVGEGLRTGVHAMPIRARVVGAYGPETDLVTDHPYAALAGATRIGRLPFNDVAALGAYLRRVIRRDHAPVSLADARLQIAAGGGGFSPLIDAAIEGVATSVLRQLTSPAYTTDLTRYDSTNRILGIDPRRQRGGVWVWMGHGLRNHLPGIDPARLALAAGGADVAVLLACYAGDFTRPDDCVAEQLLRSEQGPLAVVASTRVSMPYGNARLGAELLCSHAEASPTTTIGDLMATARDRSLAETTNPALTGLAPLARLMGPRGHSLQDERRDHADMYQLLGDPLLPICRFLPMEIETPSQLSGDQHLTIRGIAPLDGRLRMEVARLGETAAEQPTSDAPIRAGDHFAVQVPLEDTWRRGERVVRVSIESEGRLALGAAVVTRLVGDAQRVATRAPSSQPR